MSKKISINIDVAAGLKAVSDQFRDLNPKDPGQWPLVPRLLAWAAASLVVIFLGWFAVVSEQADLLEASEKKEPALKAEYKDKLAQAINLDALTQQKRLTQEYVLQLERQLPGKAEMDALLSDINQAGVGRNLLIESFKPQSIVVKDYYVELPINIRVVGRFHDIGAFASDIAHLSRIVTLHGMQIASVSSKDVNGNLAMDAVARTYRYLDPNEVADVRKAAKSKVKGAKK